MTNRVDSHKDDLFGRVERFPLSIEKIAAIVTLVSLAATGVLVFTGVPVRLECAVPVSLGSTVVWFLVHRAKSWANDEMNR